MQSCSLQGMGIYLKIKMIIYQNIVKASDYGIPHCIVFYRAV
jgi:hypothetical protein